MLCWNSPNFSCHFSKHKSFAFQILHHFSVLWHITLLYFFWLKHNILLTKVAHQSASFQIYWHIALKLYKFLMPFLVPRVNFSSKESLFHLKLFILWTKGANYSANFKIFYCSFYKQRVSFHLNFALPFSIITHNSSESF